MQRTGRRKPKKGEFRRRDIVLFVGCLAGIILSFQSEGSATFKGGFTVPWGEDLPEDAVEKLPKPVVTDVDGDGVNDLVAVVTPDKISIFENYKPSRAVGGYVQELAPKRSMHLQAPIIGFAVGYLTRPTPFNMTAGTPSPVTPAPVKAPTPRRQHIAVITDDYVVTLYNHELVEIWAVRLPVPEARDNFMYDELYDAEELYGWFLPTYANVMVLPNKIYEDDEGAIVVGVDVEVPMDMENFDDDNMGSPGRQVSYFALNGKDGALRWSHNSTDDISTSQEDKVKAQHNYKLTLQHLEHHASEQDWRYYRRNLIASLPHSYNHVHDLRMQLHRFAPKKNRKKKTAEHSAYESEAVLKDKSKDRKRTTNDYGPLGAKVQTLLTWRNKRAHMPYANVIVIHRDSGIEALHLYTGKSLAQIGPLRQGWLYEDVNDDSIIDAVSTLIGNKQHLDTYSRSWGIQSSLCKGLIWSGVPLSLNLVHNHSICLEGGLLHSFEFLRSILKGDEEEEGAAMNSLGGYEIPGFGSRDHFDESITAAPPLTVHRHVHADTFLGLAKYNTDVLFYISSGLVTCLNGKTGKVRWHTDTDAMFGAHAAGMLLAKMMGKEGFEETALKTEHREKEHVEETAHAHLKAYSLMTPTGPDPQEDVVTIRNLYNVYPTQYVLAVGQKRIAVLNAANGELEHEIILDSPPMAPVIIADANSDGVNDILVVSKHGLHCYLGKSRKGATVITATLTCVMALLALLFLTHSSVQGPGRRTTRSTD
eukprot:TRINITY_DN12851_c0_g2_i1.p1 TRINITY_DN12851_c0_g2~~TRINITY_DN12851_c0_g2_i1.p1  ORF type:complete len:784 (+),score=175.69 TRINITY_DN12851_c0_g2_i1:72-2354(+)